MANANGQEEAPDEEDELPPGLAAWFAIESVVGETIDALRALDCDTGRAVAFVSGIHEAVKTWLTWELWSSLLGPGSHSPDGLLISLLEHGVDVQQLPRSAPATPPRPGQDIEWRAFEGGEPSG